MPLRLGSPMPTLDGATKTYGAEELDPASLTGQPVLVHFWAISCHICHEVMGEVIAYRDQYRDHGLKTVAIHMPKQESDMDLAKVQHDIATYGLTHPVLVDNQHTITERFQNQFVPAFFLFDATGHLYFRAAGDKGLQNLKPKLEQLFAATVG
jgi:thiol-disulfide isomerase/thioredoxin